MMTQVNKANELLRRHELRVTDCRVDTLLLFMRHTIALSQPDVEKALGASHDRVTIYRTLTSFLEKGLIHKVPDDSGAAKYALCQGCGSHSHTDEHIHFKCTLCGHTLCIDEMPLPAFKAPQGYLFQETSVLIQGVCPQCQQ